MVHKIEGLEFISRQGMNFLPGHNIPGPGANLTSCNDTNVNNTCLQSVVLKTTILYFTFDCQKYIKLRSTLHFAVKSLITTLIQIVT